MQVPCRKDLGSDEFNVELKGSGAWECPPKGCAGSAAQPGARKWVVGRTRVGK